MAGQITVDVVGTDEVLKLLNEIPDHLYDETKKEVSRSVFNVQGAITQPMKTGVYGLQSRTGNLARSITPEVSGKTLDKLKGTISTESIYAPIHELGGKITANNAYKRLEGGPFLNIPASANRTPVGVTRMSSTAVFAQGGYIVKIKAPRARYAVMLNGKAMFWLVKDVTIKPTLRMQISADEEVPTLLSNLNKVLLKGL